jgi:hypothetical protein
VCAAGKSMHSCCPWVYPTGYVGVLACCLPASWFTGTCLCCWCHAAACNVTPVSPVPTGVQFNSTSWDVDCQTFAVQQAPPAFPLSTARGVAFTQGVPCPLHTQQLWVDAHMHNVLLVSDLCSMSLPTAECNAEWFQRLIILCWCHCEIRTCPSTPYRYTPTAWPTPCATSDGLQQHPCAVLVFHNPHMHNIKAS